MSQRIFGGEISSWSPRLTVNRVGWGWTSVGSSYLCHIWGKLSQRARLAIPLGKSVTSMRLRIRAWASTMNWDKMWASWFSVTLYPFSVSRDCFFIGVGRIAFNGAIIFWGIAGSYVSFNEKLMQIATELLKLREEKFGIYSIEFIIASTYLLDLMALQRKLNLKTNTDYSVSHIRKAFQILSKDTQAILNSYINCNIVNCTSDKWLRVSRKVSWTQMWATFFQYPVSVFF